MCPELRALVADFGELSAATQALLIFGAAQLGTDVSMLRQDIGKLLGKPIDQSLREALLVLFTSGTTVVQPGVKLDLVAQVPPLAEDPESRADNEESPSPWDIGLAV